MKKYLIFAASALALASCSSDDFLGENPGNVQNASNAINFSGDAGKITRGTKNEGTDPVKLDGQFKVYGVKKVNDALSNVFPNYSVWYVEGKNTTSNTKGWEYVGKTGDKNLGIGNVELKGSYDQTIKYWDYSASEYHFVAGSPIDAFTYQITSKSDGIPNEIKSAIVSKLAGHINPNKAGTQLNTDPVYIADPVKVVKDNYQKPVEFSFKRHQSMVRVGFYETIPGYSVSNVRFYACNDAGKLEATTGNNIILTSTTDGYFVGGTNVSGTVKYDWTKASYTFTYDDTNTNLKKSKNWYAGELGTLENKSTAEVEHLYGKDKDMSATGYFTVLPTPETTTASAILIKCDYTLSAHDSGETIKVTGATAAIPAAFSKWVANTRYTYLFKISDNTNGTTGNPDDPDHDPAGLYPITFDAVVKESTDAQYGTTTTVATPSITTYQAGSVTDKGIEYKKDEPIYATVYDQATSELKDLTTSGDVEVYKLSGERTEAELQIATIFATEITNNTPLPVTVPTTNTTVNNVTLDANKYLSFEPTAPGYYAIQYKYADGAYKYKVIEVK